MKSVRFDRLLAPAALGLILSLTGQPSRAQQPGPDQKIDAAVPVSHTSASPAPIAKDIGKAAPATASTTSSKAASKTAAQQNAAATPPKEAAKQATKPAGATMTSQQINAAVPRPNTNQLPPLTAKDIGNVAPATMTTATAKPAAQQNAAVAEFLRDLIITHRLDRYVDREYNREGVIAYYKAHDFKPIWVRDGAADARAKAAIVYLAQVNTVGLFPSDYPTPDFATATTAEKLAQDELELTNSVLNYARHAQIGQINYTRVGADISFKLDPPKPAAVLAKVAAATDTAAALDSYNPPDAGFKALRARLAALRAGKLAEPKGTAEPKRVRVPAGPILRPGMKDQRVIALRQRLDIAGDQDNPLYDQDVVDAVKAFQTKAGIAVDGLVGPSTLRALNGGKQAVPYQPADPIDTILVNMERWRWLPRPLGNSEQTYVMVNVPNYTLSLYHDGKVDWETKIVVGKPSKATPMTSSEMNYITVNPIWNVPPSIIEHDYLPALQQDPTVLQRYGLKIYQDANGTVHIYQPPGADNALGRIRFNFPNKFLVYQHDTPDKYLFKRATRAYSHGCMRVQNPLEYATKILAIELPQDNYTPDKLRSMYGPDEININLPKPIPVHLTYQTAFVDQNGKLQFRPDIYGRDAKMIAILKNRRERRVADIPIERPPNTSDQPVRMPVGTFADRNGDYDDGPSMPSFFDFLFGGTRAAAPAQRYYYRRNFIGPHAGDSGYYYR